MAAPPKTPVKPVAGARSAAPDGAATPPPPPKKSKWKLVVVAVGVLTLTLAGGAGATWYLLKDSGDEKPAAAEKDKGKAKAKEGAKTMKPPVFVNLEPFTVNLAAEGNERYLQTTIVLQANDDKAAEAMKAYMPVIRNRVLLLLASKRPSDLDSGEGKRKLVTELVAVVREAVPGTTPESGATGALFSSFVIQ